MRGVLFLIGGNAESLRTWSALEHLLTRMKSFYSVANRQSTSLEGIGVNIADVKKNLAKERGTFQQLLDELEERLASKRDDEKLPVYSTKYRIKSVDSLFLKLKRKNKHLDQITDIAGFRILVLFRQDILPVHNEFLNILSELDYRLIECTLYNWNEPKDFIEKIKRSADRLLEKNRSTTTQDDKKSGYRSIHYLIEKHVGNKKYCLEVQLRTLLQDVWAELEHALAYKKGMILPQIKQGFMVLSKELEAKDVQLQSLKSAFDEERALEEFLLRQSGPYGFFWYEKDCLPSHLANGALKQECEKYKSLLDEADDKKAVVEEAWKLLGSIEGQISAKDANEELMHYWILSEKAYLTFLERRHEEALRKYNEITDKYPERYVPFFRKGELHMILGDITAALVSFDEAEHRIGKISDHDYRNEYHIKVKLAYIYWRLGAEFYRVAYNKILEAVKIFNDHRLEFPEGEEIRLQNNKCWYSLEIYLKEREKRPVSKDDLKKEMQKLESLVLEGKGITAHALDTLAWFYYNEYVDDRNKKEFLRKAKEYCQQLLTLKTSTTMAFHSLNLRKSHLQKILTAR
ncbi:hypothetical protein D6779_05715 [Candidatus Parcubacteria bacterium]|nr:MAG: hypothetical protein D6779_05715 [Candidatus Parcubacteria bacterium]